MFEEAFSKLLDDNLLFENMGKFEDLGSDVIKEIIIYADKKMINCSTDPRDPVSSSPISDEDRCFTLFKLC